MEKNIYVYIYHNNLSVLLERESYKIMDNSKENIFFEKKAVIAKHTSNQIISKSLTHTYFKYLVSYTFLFVTFERNYLHFSVYVFFCTAERVINDLLQISFCFINI